MSPPRVLLVTQRFWPLVGRAPKVMANLAGELASGQVDLTVVTARWHPRWPAEIRYRGVPVVRLPHSPGHGSRPASRYLRSLGRWLRRNRSRYDLVCVSALRDEAHAVLGAIGGQVPVVLRAERAGPSGDCLWQLDARGGPRIKRRCLKAEALIGPTRAVERELIAAGYPRQRIHYVPNGVAIPPAPDADRKASMRAAVADVNPGLHVPDGAPLAVCVGRLHQSKGLVGLLAAWQRIVAERRHARLWLVGEGPYREALEAEIARWDLLGKVFLTGVFHDVEDLLAGADLYVSPSPEEGPSLALLEAMGAGLPIVATDIPGNRELVSHEQHGLLVPAGDADALAAAVGRLFSEPELAARLAAAAREQARRDFSLARMADAHLELWKSLARSSPIQD